MTEQKRIRRFLIDLDDLIMNNMYYDDDICSEVFEITEDEAYDILMEKEEYHFIGTKKVRGFIHIFFSDFRSKMCILEAYNAL